MAVTSAITAVAALGASVYQGQAQQQQAKKAQSAQQAQQNQLISDQNQQQAQQKSLVTRDSQLAQERAAAGASTGYNSTILTSPLGIQGSDANQTGKTLLGS